MSTMTRIRLRATHQPLLALKARFYDEAPPRVSSRGGHHDSTSRSNSQCPLRRPAVSKDATGDGRRAGEGEPSWRRQDELRRNAAGTRVADAPTCCARRGRGQRRGREGKRSEEHTSEL